jgi:hypothetical protein
MSVLTTVPLAPLPRLGLDSSGGDSGRLLTLGPDNALLWVRLYVHPYTTHWADNDELDSRNCPAGSVSSFFGTMP